MKNIFGDYNNPIYSDEYGGMEEYDMLAEELDEELYEEYLDDFEERIDPYI